MPMRTKDMWFIFIPPGRKGAGRWHIPPAHAGTEQKRIAYAEEMGATRIIRHDKIEWRES